MFLARHDQESGFISNGPTETTPDSAIGAVIFGIGVALMIELFGVSRQIRGLGLGGAIVINIIGALVLIYWLTFATLEIPLKGRIILWIVGMVVFLIGIAEAVTRSWIYDE